MGQNIWINPEFRAAMFKTAITAIILSVLAFFYFNLVFGSMNIQLIQKNIATAGILLQKHPEMKDDIITAFTTEAGPEELRTGFAAAREYGYTEKLPIAMMPVLGRFSGYVLVVITAIPVICFALAALLYYLSQRKFYMKIREAAFAAERIVEGDFNIKLDEQTEGDFSKLGHSFNQMAKRLELTLEQLVNEKIFLKNIISDISHQLKTPLSSIKVFNEILTSGKTVNEPDKERFLVKSGEQIERMEWLIQNLLLMARLEAGAIEFTDEDKPLKATVENVLDALKDKWEAKGQKVRLICQTSGIKLPHDEKWLGEALGNIIKNSIEHTGEGGSIDVEISSTPVVTTVMISDNGEGISSEDLPHIFKRFYKGRNKSHGSGTGIGLALSKAIIENEGGIIGVRSLAGKGSTFTITFPNFGRNLTKL